MPKFPCRCGNVLNISVGWSDYELVLLPQCQIEKIGESLTPESPMDIRTFYELVDEAGIRAYKCPICSRIYLERTEKKNTFITYVPEDKNK